VNDFNEKGFLLSVDVAELFRQNPVDMLYNLATGV